MSNRKQQMEKELREIKAKAKKWGVKVNRKIMSKRVRKIYDEATGIRTVHGKRSFRKYYKAINEIE